MSWYRPKVNLTEGIKQYLIDLSNVFQVLDTKKRRIPYTMEPHQIEWHAHDVVPQGANAKHKLAVKSRNTSFTTSALITVLASIPYYPNQVIPVVRLNQVRANDLIEDFKSMIRNMRPIREENGSLWPFDPSKVNMENSSSIKFPNGVEIRAFPATNAAAETIRGLRIAGCAGIIDECLPGNVRLQTPNGLKNISSLKQGDIVRSYNFKKGVVENKPVLGVLKKPREERVIYNISFQKNSYSLKCTDNHPIYLSDGSLKRADELRIGDEVMCFNNKNGYKLTSEQKEILYGILLGDGHLGLEKKYKQSCYLKISHGEKQRQYQEHLQKIFGGKQSKHVKTSYNGSVNYLITQNLKELKQVYNELYINNKKTVTKNFFNKLTDKSLAYWFMDDGSKSSNCYSLSTHGFSYDEHLIIKKWFEEKYKIIPNIKFDNRNDCYYLTFNRDNSRLLSRIISPYVIPSMRYKLIKNIMNKNYKELKFIKNNYKTVIVRDIKTRLEKKYVYNIEVADNNNYMIEGMGVLSHNCNFMKDYKSIYIALRDAAAGSDEDGEKEYQMIIGTTRKGRSTPFNLWFEKIEKNPPSDIHIYRWPVLDPNIVDLDKSLLEQDGLMPITKWHSLKDLENKRKENINTFKEEYMAILTDGDSQLYPFADVQQCTLQQKRIESYDNELFEGVPYIGIDVATGAGQDYFVVSVFDKTIDGLHTQRLLWYSKDDSMSTCRNKVFEIVDSIAEHNNEWYCRIDSQGPGQQLAQELTERYGKNNIESISGNEVIKFLKTGTKQKFQVFLHERQLQLLSNNLVRLFDDEVQTIHYTVWDSNYRAPSGNLGHGDITMANGYALLPKNWKYGGIDYEPKVVNKDIIDERSDVVDDKDIRAKVDDWIKNASLRDKKKFYRRQ